MNHPGADSSCARLKTLGNYCQENQTVAQKCRLECGFCGDDEQPEETDAPTVPETKPPSLCEGKDDDKKACKKTKNSMGRKVCKHKKGTCNDYLCKHITKDSKCKQGCVWADDVGCHDEGKKPERDCGLVKAKSDCGKAFNKNCSWDKKGELCYDKEKPPPQPECSNFNGNKKKCKQAGCKYSNGNEECWGQAEDPEGGDDTPVDCTLLKKVKCIETETCEYDRRADPQCFAQGSNDPVETEPPLDVEECDWCQGRELDLDKQFVDLNTNETLTCRMVMYYCATNLEACGQCAGAQGYILSQGCCI